MNKSYCDHPIIARHARHLTRLTKHLIEEAYFFRKETNEYLLRRGAENIAFIIAKIQDYIDALEDNCDRLNITDIEEIVIQAIREAK